MQPPEPNVDSAIAENVAAHDRVATKYEQRHLEIFNHVEQARLAATLAEGIRLITTGEKNPYALDFGCGSGNLTRRLREHGCRVTSADVSPRFLELLASEFPGPDGVSTHRLNGRDLAGIADGTFDLVATYSVLHHVPDYLHAVEEFARVVRPGGVVYIDHEVAPTHWQPTPELEEYRRRGRPAPPPPPSALRFLNPATYLRKARTILDPQERYRRRMRATNPRWREEGDIHVWPDDHIEWDKVEARLAAFGFETVLRRDYLHYNAVVPLSLWEEFHDKCADMRVLVMRRRG